MGANYKTLLSFRAGVFCSIVYLPVFDLVVYLSKDE